MKGNLYSSHYIVLKSVIYVCTMYELVLTVYNFKHFLTLANLSHINICELGFFNISVNKYSKAKQCLHGWVQGGKRCYLPVINQLTSWLGARMNCLALEADLVSINTAQEQVIVNRIMEVRIACFLHGR